MADTDTDRARAQERTKEDRLKQAANLAYQLRGLLAENNIALPAKLERELLEFWQGEQES